MQIWVGLGNPGAQYALNRHNIGFMVADALADFYDFSSFTKRFKSLASEGRIGGEKILLLKPQTFMNVSGEAVRAALDFYKLDRGVVTVLHDELDIAPFCVKLKTGGGSAGHNGIKSVAQHIGADFQRVRLGIGHPGRRDAVHDYVLGNFSRKEQEELTEFIGDIVKAAPALAQGQAKPFMDALA
jgi:peptidyl-tRNA hydrolase, PTH1 family